MTESRSHAQFHVQPVLRISNLSIDFPKRNGSFRAVDAISLDVWPKEIVGVIGESGSGKTMTALSIMRLLPHGTHLSGSIQLGECDLLNLSNKQMRKLQGDRLAFIPQDAMQSLNPTLRIGRQVGEPFEVHRKNSFVTALKEAVSLLGSVRISDAKQRAMEYPHQFSGGMQQRAMIAMGLALQPELIIADEPTTALDVTVQFQILKLFREVRDETGAAILFITHELGIVAELCDWVYVMHMGKIIEHGPVKRIFTAPQMDYTRMLLAATPSIHSGRKM